MRAGFVRLVVGVAFMYCNHSAWGQQRAFPTGELGTQVSYVASPGPNNPSACLLAITTGLPKLALAFMIQSNQEYSIFLTLSRPFPNIAVGSGGTIKIGSQHIFINVKSAQVEGGDYTLILSPVERGHITPAFDAIDRISYFGARLDFVIDDAQIPGLILGPAPSIPDALKNCLRYMVAN